MTTATTTKAMQQASRTCAFFMNFAGVKEAYLFGSVARCGTGKDIDLIFVVEKDLADAFATAVKYRQNKTSFSRNRGKNRLEIALCLLDVPETLLKMGGATCKEGDRPLDVFLFPPDWRDKIEELEKLFPSKDGHLVERVSEQVRKFDLSAPDHFVPYPPKFEPPMCPEDDPWDSYGWPP